MKKNYLTKNNYSIAAGVSVLALSRLTKFVVKGLYQKITGSPAPLNPESKHHSVREVILFSTGMALATAAVKFMGRKYLSKYWSFVNGELPEHLS